MKKIIKKCFKQCFKIINYLPFNNQIRFRRKNNNLLKIKGAQLLHCKIRCRGGKNNQIICHDGVRLNNCSFYINGDNNLIEIGANSSIINGEFYIEDNKNIISIGSKTQISGKTHLACIEGTSIQIGDNCLFSSNIVLRTGDAHSVLNLEGDRINPSVDINIGNHVWIGNSVILNKGASIPENSVVGIGSIVTKSFVEPNVAIAGVPAKIIKTGINWCTKRI